MLGRLFCKNYLFLWMNFLNPTPNIRSLKKTAQGKVAKTHFPGNKTKNPIKSASSWHSFLTLSNEVLQKAWGVSGPTRIPLVHHRAPSPAPAIQCGSAQRRSAPVAGSACDTRGQKSEWHLALSLSTNNRKELSKSRPPLFGRPGSWSLPGAEVEERQAQHPPTLQRSHCKPGAVRQGRTLLQTHSGKHHICL